MSQNDAPFKWTRRKILALEMLASLDLGSQQAIADRLGISRMQLWRWRQNPEFAKRLQARLDGYGAALLAEKVRRHANRDKRRKTKSPFGI
jgi:hypothetical protein